jgi:hypothetical protein
MQKQVMANKPVIAARPRPIAPAVEAHEGLSLRISLTHWGGIKVTFGSSVGITSSLEECSLSDGIVLSPLVVVCLWLVAVCLRCVGLSWIVVCCEPFAGDPTMAMLSNSFDVVVVIVVVELIVVVLVVVTLVVILYGPAQCSLPSWCGSFPK